MPGVYLETSVISYLTSRPARDVIVLAHQQLTREWWDSERQNFELYISEIVAAEAERGDPDAARARLDLLRETRQLSASDEAERLVPILLRETGLPRKALADMSHIALATGYTVCSFFSRGTASTSRTRMYYAWLQRRAGPTASMFR